MDDQNYFLEEDEFLAAANAPDEEEDKFEEDDDELDHGKDDWGEGDYDWSTEDDDDE